MCDRCLPSEPSRRDVLRISALGLGAAALAACQPNQQPTYELPDVYEDHLIAEVPGGPVKVDKSKIITPPPTKAAASEYGSIMPRAAWTRTPLRLADGTPMAGVSKITLHHTGDGKPFVDESSVEVARHLQLVHLAHLQRGMIDIAYHFAVDPAGRVWQLRWLQYEGQHVRNSRNGTRNNPHNIGVVVLGDFNVQRVTVPQRDRLFELVRLLRSKYALPAGAVYMHGEIVETDCPGRTLKPLVSDARRRGIV